ncbi:hypothetical protein NUW58_g3147 [Xylaria curta]|uniref:Uncharacterized protein n=1 Tax=Xylaria curta TaxID=42375 RepID=A0ACC1PEM0_9PEZI|nr:hypothetical protein NUW58_g3147 [Xylaria curta]
MFLRAPVSKLTTVRASHLLCSGVPVSASRHAVTTGYFKYPSCGMYQARHLTCTPTVLNKSRSQAPKILLEDAEKGFGFVRHNPVAPKPRNKAVTEIRGPYYSVMGSRYLSDVLETMGAHIDGLKFAGGSFALFPEAQLRELIDLAHAHNAQHPPAPNTQQEEDRDWQQVEALVSRIVGSRDALRRLVKDLAAEKQSHRPMSSHLSPGSTDISEEGDGYFAATSQPERRSFWKRKSSASLRTPASLAPTVSSSLAVPMPSSAATPRLNGANSKRLSKSGDQVGRSTEDHCTALLNDLDLVVADFTNVIANSKRRRSPLSRAPIARKSMESSLSADEFFDAEAGEPDNSGSVLVIDRHESDAESPESVADEASIDDVSSVSSIESDAEVGDKSGVTALFPSRPKTLHPLPVDIAVDRRNTIPPATVLPPSLIAFVRKNVGKDLSTISMPVSANEPTSMLQRVAEQLEYAQLLDQAARQKIPRDRLLFVTAFAISSFSVNRAKERAIRKPFNPLLGETFELLRTESEVPGGFRLLVEKVTHRPVRLAMQADAANWSLAQSPALGQKFWGKSAEITTDGRVRVALHLPDGTDELYSWNIGTMFLRNVVMGEKYVEPVGNMTVLNESSGAKANIEFKTKGMFGGRCEDLQVDTYGPDGAATGVSLTGTWTKSLQVVEGGKSTGQEIWRAGQLVPDAANTYGMTTFAAGLNEITGVEKNRLPPTDTRLRPDQRLAEQGKLDDAEIWKVKLEEAQRARRREMEDRGEEHKPRWFYKVADTPDGEELWRFKGVPALFRAALRKTRKHALEQRLHSASRSASVRLSTIAITATNINADNSGIDIDERSKAEPSDLLQSAASNLQSRSIDPYYETEPTVKEYLLEHRPTLAGFVRYVRSLFPFLDWIFHYNVTWLLGDLIAGITVGFVVVPQGMAYALLAGLKPEYGLYTSFVGFILYFLFATSKDITIGTVAVMSTLVGRIVGRVTEAHPEFTPEEIARGLSVIAGAVLLFIGLVRLGWIVEFIPLVGICSFMTGAAVSIAAGQVPKLLGVSGVNTRDSTYIVIIDTLRALPTAKLDAALGLTTLFLLYTLRWFCNYMAQRQPTRKKTWFFVGTLRLAFVILLYTLISWLANRDITDAKNAKFSILGTVPSGFRIHGAPNISPGLISAFAADLPATIIVLIIEHIAISKSFGRLNNYVINPSQELVAVGFTNVFGPFLGAYPATGSFSRTAIKAKAGVRTPLAGLWTALLVVLALYALTKVFFYIPMASLSGLIIHAVGDLLTPPATVYQFWQVSPIEVVLFFAGVIIMVFTDIETGVYFVVAASAALLLLRVAKAHGSFLGKVDVYRVGGDASEHDSPSERGVTAATKREAFLALNRRDGSNTNISIRNPYPGVFVYRFSEGFNYANTAHYMDELVAYIQQHTRPTTSDRFEKIGDRPWNNPGPRRGKVSNVEDNRPVFRALILDFASVNNVDVTAIQGLIDTRTQLDYHTYPDRAEWHIADVNNRWTRRALAASGFGFPRVSADASGEKTYWRPIFSVAASENPYGSGSETTVVIAQKDVEAGLEPADRISSSSRSDAPRTNEKPEKLASLQGVNRPYFHLDVAAAVETAITNVEGNLSRQKIA